MSASDTSVVVPAYNAEAFLSDCLESILSQTAMPGEIVVVDDGSTDRTAEVAGSFGPPVRLVRQANRGLAGARNRGAAEASRHLVAFLDADDLWCPQKLERQLIAFDAGGAAVIHCGMVEVDEDLNPLRERLDGLSGDGVSHRMLAPGGLELHANGSTMLLSAEVFRELGGFDERLPCAEDWDFCFRAALSHSVVFLAEPLVLYRRHGGTLSKDPRRTQTGMGMALEKAFAAAPELSAHRRRAYGRYHLMLAGLYAHEQSWRRAAHHSVRALALDPTLARRVAGYPMRRRARQLP